MPVGGSIMRVMWLQRMAKLILEGLKYFRSQEL